MPIKFDPNLMNKLHPTVEPIGTTYRKDYKSNIKGDIIGTLRGTSSETTLLLSSSETQNS